LYALSALPAVRRTVSPTVLPATSSTNGLTLISALTESAYPGRNRLLTNMIVTIGLTPVTRAAPTANAASSAGESSTRSRAATAWMARLIARDR